MRGQALKDAQIWVSSHKLTEQDYQFLNASERLEKEEQEKTFLAERTKQVEALLFQEKPVLLRSRQRTTGRTLRRATNLKYTYAN
ncbi:MAG: hypothetical protein HC784_01265 [Hydrococcus sp. CSU_1_8]|nr:hypothetical protein [Hydrococcus sp. CSU_1_8]